MLNTRETAITIWLGLILVWGLSRSEIRTSMARMLRALAHFKILGPIMIAGGVVAVTAYGLHLLGFWEISELKDTAVWFFFAGISMLYRGIASQDPDGAIRKMVKDSFAIILIAEFILNAYTFPFWAEFTLFPFLVLLAMSQALVDFNANLHLLRRPLKAVQTLFGFSIIGLTLWGLSTDYGQVFSYSSLEAFSLPIILSAVFIPLAYGMGLLAAYENLFVPLKVGIRKPLLLRVTARIHLIAIFGLSLRAVTEARRKLNFELGLIQSREDLDRVLRPLLRRGTADVESKFPQQKYGGPRPWSSINH